MFFEDKARSWQSRGQRGEGAVSLWIIYKKKGSVVISATQTQNEYKIRTEAKSIEIKVNTGSDMFEGARKQRRTPKETMKPL